jgi:type IV secretion system protein VirD4
MLVNENDRSLQHKMDNIRKEHTNLKTGERMPPSPAYAPFAIFMQSSETVRSSVIIGLGSKLQVLQSKQVRNITNYTDIDLELPGKQKCAYFCIISDQDSTFEFISSLFFSFLFIKLVRYADNYTLTGCLSPQVEFILDEFPNSCIIPDMQKKINTTRSPRAAHLNLLSECWPDEEPLSG